MRKGILVALLLTIITPLILSYIFLTLLTPIDWTRMDSGFPQILGILSFSSLAFAYSVPLFGYGYIIPLFIWLITGFFALLLNKPTNKPVMSQMKSGMT